MTTTATPATSSAALHEAVPPAPKDCSTEMGSASLSRSVAHLDVASLTGLGLLVTGVLMLRRRGGLGRGFAAVLLSLVGMFAALLLRMGRRSGVTDDEVKASLPGDNTIEGSYTVTDRAITVEATVEKVWPWVEQMGYHRGGWYTSARLDKFLWRIDNPSEDRIVPEYLGVKPGDIIPDGEPGTAYFTVTEVEKDSHIVYLDNTGSHVPGVNFTWAFVLRPLEDGQTRIHVRWRNGPVNSRLIRLMVPFLVAPADFVMMGQVLRGIKRRAESPQLAGPEAVR